MTGCRASWSGKKLISANRMPYSTTKQGWHYWMPPVTLFSKLNKMFWDTCIQKTVCLTRQKYNFLDQTIISAETALLDTT